MLDDIDTCIQFAVNDSIYFTCEWWGDDDNQITFVGLCEAANTQTGFLLLCGALIVCTLLVLAVRLCRGRVLPDPPAVTHLVDRCRCQARLDEATKVAEYWAGQLRSIDNVPPPTLITGASKTDTCIAAASPPYI
jgi:hypothetical protein